MSLASIPLEHIGQSDLDGLITAKSREAIFIEYKRETYGGKDSERAEFLADVSSFANARGGDLLIGIEAHDGIPTNLTPFGGNANSEILRLEQMARSGIEPRIPSLQIRAVPVDAEGHVLVIRTGRSYQQPHRVIFAGRNKFWSRSSAGKFEPNVDELRVLFTFAPQVSEYMRKFRIERLSQIASGDGPVQLSDATCMLLHIVPFSHFFSECSVSFEKILPDIRMFPPIGTDVRGDWRINLDGFLTLANAVEGAEAHRAYVQVFRTGAIESIDASISTANLNVDIRSVDKKLVDYVRLYVNMLHDCGVDGPLVVMVSLLGMQGRMLTCGKRDFAGAIQGNRVSRDQIHYGEVIIDRTPVERHECATALKPMLDQMANSAGMPSAISFDGSGRYVF